MEEDFLVAQDIYLKAGVHIGTKFKTKYMANFIYKTRGDGLSVLNVQKIDRRLRIAAKMLSRYNPEDILIVGRRENSWKSVRAFSEATGTKAFIGRYPPGTITNPNLKTFMEVKIVLITDSWPDRNVMMDAFREGIPVVALCDTNNQTNYIDLVVPCNNKGKKSLGLVYFILAREYLKNRGAIAKDDDFKYTIEDFTEE